LTRTDPHGLSIRLGSDKIVADIKGVITAGPAPAPLLRADTFYRYQIMLRAPRMSVLSQRLAQLTQSLALDDDVILSVDIDPVEIGDDIQEKKIRQIRRRSFRIVFVPIETGVWAFRGVGVSSVMFPQIRPFE